MQALHSRLVSANRDFKIGLTACELTKCVQRAVSFAHIDLFSFFAETGVFLDNSWKLLPEWDDRLWNETVTIADLHHTLLTLRQKYRGLPRDRILPTFEDFPSKKILEDRLRLMEENLEIVGRYIGARALSLEVLNGVCILRRDMSHLPASQVLYS